MKQAIFAIIIIATLGTIGFFITKNDANESATPTTSTANSSAQNTNSAVDSESTDNETLKAYTLAEVATHNSENDCWTTIDGNVYDITSYIPRHSGGDDILLACGVDGSTLFNSRETADGQQVGSGSSHSSSAARQLTSLQIGTLTE